MKSAVALLLSSVVFAQEDVLETCEPAIFEQHAKAINQEAPYVRLNNTTPSNHSDSGYVAIQQDVYSQSFQTYQPEILMSDGIVQNITSLYYEEVHSVLFVDSIAEWESGSAINFTITTSDYCYTPTTQSELRKRAPRSDRYSVFFEKLSTYIAAFNTLAEFVGHCVDGGQALNKAVTYLNQDSVRQRVALYYGSNCYDRALHVWVDAWQDRSFTGDDFMSIFVDYGRTR